MRRCILVLHFSLHQLLVPARPNSNTSSTESFHAPLWQIKSFFQCFKAHCNPQYVASRTVPPHQKYLNRACKRINSSITWPVKKNHIFWMISELCIQIHKLPDFHDHHALFTFSLNKCSCACNHLTALFCPRFSEEHVHLWCAYILFIHCFAPIFTFCAYFHLIYCVPSLPSAAPGGGGRKMSFSTQYCMRQQESNV